MGRLLNRAAFLAGFVGVVAVFAGVAFARAAPSVPSGHAADTTAWKLVQAQCSAGQLPAGEGCFDKPAAGTGVWAAGPQSATWTYPDSGGSQWTVNYAYPVPSQLPAAGVAMTLSVTAIDPAGGPGNGIDGQVCIGSLSTFAVKESNNCASAYAMHPGDTTQGHGSVTLIPPSGGVGSQAFLVIDMGGGHQVHFTYQAQRTQSLPPKSGDAASVGSLQGEVTVTHADGSVEAVTSTTVLRRGDQLATGVDSKIALTFPDGSRMDVREMTQLHVADLLVQGSRQNVSVALNMGEVSALVHPKKAYQTDFKVTTPSGTTSSRGTEFTVFYDAAARVTIVRTLVHKILFTPKRRGAKAVIVPAGKEIAATASSVSSLAPIGKAGARGGVDIQSARDLALAFVDRSAGACALLAPRGAATTVKPAGPAGWTVAIAVAGKVTGASSWKVAGPKVTPVNTLAQQIAAGCR